MASGFLSLRQHDLDQVLGVISQAEAGHDRLSKPPPRCRILSIRSSEAKNQETRRSEILQEIPLAASGVEFYAELIGEVRRAEG